MAATKIYQFLGLEDQGDHQLIIVWEMLTAEKLEEYKEKYPLNEITHATYENMIDWVAEANSTIKNKKLELVEGVYKWSERALYYEDEQTGNIYGNYVRVR